MVTDYENNLGKIFTGRLNNNELTQKPKKKIERWFKRKTNFMRDLMIFYYRFYRIFNETEERIVDFIKLADVYYQCTINRARINENLFEDAKVCSNVDYMIVKTIKLTNEYKSFMEEKIRCIDYNIKFFFRRNINKCAEYTPLTWIVENLKECLKDYIKQFNVVKMEEWNSIVLKLVKKRELMSTLEYFKYIYTYLTGFEYPYNEYRSKRKYSQELFLEFFKRAEKIAYESYATLYNPFNGSFEPMGFDQFQFDAKIFYKIARKITKQEYTTFNDTFFEEYKSLTNITFFTSINEYLNRFQKFLRNTQAKPCPLEPFISFEPIHHSTKEIARKFVSKNRNMDLRIMYVDELCDKFVFSVDRFDLSDNKIFDDKVFPKKEDLNKSPTDQFILKKFKNIKRKICREPKSFKAGVRAIVKKAQFILRNLTEEIKAMKYGRRNYAKKNIFGYPYKREEKYLSSVIRGPLRIHYEEKIIKGYIPGSYNPLNGRLNNFTKGKYWDMYINTCNDIIEDAREKIYCLRIATEMRSLKKLLRVKRVLDKMMLSEPIIKSIDKKKLIKFVSTQFDDYESQLKNTFIKLKKELYSSCYNIPKIELENEHIFARRLSTLDDKISNYLQCHKFIISNIQKSIKILEFHTNSQSFIMIRMHNFLYEFRMGIEFLRETIFSIEQNDIFGGKTTFAFLKKHRKTISKITKSIDDKFNYPCL
ncbi:hypothetical protein EDEG_02595 [Edhazardia aedis USNM 41457]|uniref:Uncharacterized protein n=1 Tax=Edhazardia aedis (strain USNM 41457) TaxID=1003232 RepID=J8ZTK8_EDHAE|nr:hypothetical protein EDEG_02595 [Edhazardia aedis USNM 41457]|eukprot:EJW03013.1 hypothetical protein EDEG_02595 [Edhazardia aedis USNM 41457]